MLQNMQKVDLYNKISVLLSLFTPIFVGTSLMCGILGAITHSPQLTSNRFREALLCMHKRGPDAQGVFEDDSVYLGQVRLSIIDTSSGANQPFFDPTERYVLVFNGEIFNYRELKKSHLSTFDIPFKTQSDTEVLLHLLIRYGTACLPWLSGFFAFALYDRVEKRLILARDRFGKKPLYLYEDEQMCLFGSEMKSLMPLMPKRQLNKEAMALYFQLNYLPPTMCMLQGVRKIQPGQVMVHENNTWSSSFFYAIQIKPEQYKQYTYSEAQTKLRTLMEQSVQERLISDVPLGAFLSGGIDSSVVVALAAQHTNQLKTYSIGFNNPLFDETPYAQLVAKQYQTDHHVFYLSENDYKEELYNILDYLDEPFADSSCIPQYILCKKTKEHVTVALSGDGGDEVFAGYNKHRAEWMIRNKPLMALAARTASPLLKQLPQNKNTRWGNIARQLVKLGDGAALSNRDRYIRWASILNRTDTLALFNPSVQANLNKVLIDNTLAKFTEPIQHNDFNEVLLADMHMVLPGDMLQKVDWMSMANSLEVRSPFLDYRVVDFAFGLPEQYKIDAGLKKKIVQDSFRSILPDALYNRPKQGFDIPLLDWFRTDLNDYIFNQLLHPDFIAEQGLFSNERIQWMRKKLHSANPGYVQATLWALIVFQHWYKKYIKL